MSAVLVFLGVFVTVLSVLSALRLRPTLARLHTITPITSLAAPLIGAGLVIANGWSLTTATVAVIVVLMAITGPVLSAATGRLAAQEESRDG
jgi:multisubunit Na+/H+ antiporter MnhG subunit